MAFTQFPNEQLFIALESDTETRLGSFELASALNLKHIMITIFIRGVLSGDEQFKLNIYPNNRLITPIVSSSWADLSGIGTYSGNWIGNVYSDFDGHPLVAGQSYYVTIETNDYTRNADTFYIGVNLDWGSPVNTQVTSGLTGARMRILGTS